MLSAQESTYMEGRRYVFFLLVLFI